ncbi:25067_t:CDS:1, partial [Gigaspora rosea]
MILHKIPKIERLTLAKIHCEFKLLLRATRDGFTSKIFHQLCDNKGATIVIIKVKSSGEIIGGYNPICWGYKKKKGWYYWDRNEYSTKYLYTDDSFIFSLGTCKNSWNAKFGFVKKHEPAIRDDPNLGPCFGKEDIYMKNKVCSSESSSFDNIILAKSFSIIEYEVFQVVYKRSEENRWVSFMDQKYFEND